MEQDKKPITIEPPKNENIFTVDDVIEDISHKIEHGLEPGTWTGFNNLYEHYTMQPGSMTFVIAGAGVGKSSLLYELMLNTAEYSGWKWALFSDEVGSVADLYLELMWAYARKPIVKHNIKGVPQATKEEIERTVRFVREHFFVIDSGLKEMNPDIYFKAVIDIEREKGVKINGMLIDPVTNINYNLKGDREDVALGRFLDRTRKHASSMNIHSVVTVHTRSQQPIKGKLINGEDVYYTPPPTYTDTAGGMQWSRKGFMILGLWRPPEGLPKPDPNGGESVEEYKANELIVEILKSKPKVAGKRGKVSLFYDWASSRFYDEFGAFSYPKEESEQKKIEEVQEQLPF